MDVTLFSQVFKELSIPVVVCDNTGAMPVVYMNVQAGLLFSPSRPVDVLTGKAADTTVDDLFRFATPEEGAAFHRMAGETGQVDQLRCEALTFEGRHVPVALFGNAITWQGGNYFVIYLAQQGDAQTPAHLSGEEQLSAIVAASFVAGNVDDSIQTVLAMAGQCQRVSRAYIFEEMSATITRNTYEWCAPGVQPAIQDLQELQKADYNYDVIVNSGYYITNDVRNLPDGDREILEMQGIRSLAIITLYDYGLPLGYVGFDDTAHYRVWTQSEIQFLRNIASILATLIKRRKAEQSVRDSQNVMQLMLDASDSIAYANTLDDYTIQFASRALAEALGKSQAELLGQKCWAQFQLGQSGPCPFCPIPKIEWTPGEERSPVYTWETTNPLTHKTYLARDSIVKWVDGQYVHVETAVDISTRKDYEDQLQYFASTDAMTGAFNRNWGARRLEAMLGEGVGGSLVFLDLDGLKKVNDQYGHTFGDEMITSVVNVLRRQIQAGEVMCRWGGDEFLLWMDAGPDEAEKRMLLVLAELDERNRTATRPYKLAFSHGIVAFNTGEGATLDALVTVADKRLYQTKMARRGIKLNRRSEDQL